MQVTGRTVVSCHARQMGLWLDSARIFRLHLLLIAILVGTHVVLVTTRLFTGADRLQGLLQLFNLNAENNLPSLFSAVAMLAAAGLLWATASGVGRDGLPFAYAWRLLAVIFVFLAIDEAVGLHEQLNRPLRQAMGTGGAFYFAWVIPYLVLVALLIGALGRFLWSLERVTRRGFVVAGATYVAGAIAMEMLGGWLWSAGRMHGRAYLIETTIEETLEMLGIALFIRAILRFHELRVVVAPRALPDR